MTVRLRCRWPFEPWACSCCGTVIDGRAPSSVLAGLACDECLDHGRKGEPYIPLTVRPVGPSAKREERPILAVSMREQRCAIEGGEVFELAGLVDRVRDRKPGETGKGHELPDRVPPAIVITDHSLDLLAMLDQSAASSSPFWQWQVAIKSGSAWRPEARSRSRLVFLTPRPIRFGYASRRGNRQRAKGRAHWYLLIEPASFCELPDGWGTPDVVELLRFGLELRAWANNARLPVLQAVSSYGSRLLRDARFSGEGWRRKIPASTNRRIRSLLPGNHYQLLGRPGFSYSHAHKWDQEAAHHHAALMSRFPHPDMLEAAGWYRRPAPPARTAVHERGAIAAGSDRWRELLDRPGLFVVALRVPERVSIDALQLPALRRAGTSWQHLTSGEIEHVRSMAADGVRLLDLWCAWTSPEEDDRLREYALWSGAQLGRATPTVRRWLKPLLLAAYGMLAVRPSRFRNGWRWCYNADGAVGWSTRYGELVGLERQAKREQESQTVNVLWRAIIESSVRLESLKFAQHVRADGLRPVAVYADAVFATGRHENGSETLCKPPWRYEGAVHDLTFESPGRYRSREETRLPGVPRQDGRQLGPPLPPRGGETHGNTNRKEGASAPRAQA